MYRKSVCVRAIRELIDILIENKTKRTFSRSHHQDAECTTQNNVLRFYYHLNYVYVCECVCAAYLCALDSNSHLLGHFDRKNFCRTFRWCFSLLKLLLFVPPILHITYFMYLKTSVFTPFSLQSILNHNHKNLREKKIIRPEISRSMRYEQKKNLSFIFREGE